MKVFGIIVFMAIAFFAGLFVSQSYYVDKPNWTCEYEDQVLMITNKCVQIDDLDGRVNAYAY